MYCISELNILIHIKTYINGIFKTRDGIEQLNVMTG